MKKTEYTLCSPVNRTIALVTDLHEYDPEPVLNILRQVQPDVIAVAGDTLERHNRGENLDKGDRSVLSRLICAAIRTGEMLRCFFPQETQKVQTENAHRFLREAGKIAPIVMSLGNHELFLTEDDRRAIAEAGAVLLQNTSIQMDGILFGGIPSKQSAEHIDEGFLRSFSEAAGIKVLLCHHPEYYPELSKYNIELILSGHCHGGQIRILGRGVFAPGQGLLPRYHHGVYDGRLVVSAGCANTVPIPRWGNETEVVVLKLQ